MDSQKMYNTGFDDGVEHVLGLMESFVARSVIVGSEPLYIRAVEEMLEDVRNTLDYE